MWKQDIKIYSSSIRHEKLRATLKLQEMDKWGQADAKVKRKERPQECVYKTEQKQLIIAKSKY